MPTYSSSVCERHSQTIWVSELTNSGYQDDQQVKLKHLQAEVESLLQQLQDLKEQRLAAISEEK